MNQGLPEKARVLGQIRKGGFDVPDFIFVPAIDFANQNFTELESSFQEEVDSSRNLAYVFIITTAIAIITVIVLLMRKPKRVWV